MGDWVTELSHEIPSQICLLGWERIPILRTVTGCNRSEPIVSPHRKWQMIFSSFLILGKTSFLGTYVWWQVGMDVCMGIGVSSGLRIINSRNTPRVLDRSRIRIWPQFRCIPNRTKYQGLGTSLVRILNLLKYIHSFPLNILHYPGGPPSLPSTSSLAVTSLPLNTYPTLFSGERQNDKINGFQNNEKVAFWVTQGSGVFSLDCDLQVIKCIVDS